MNEKTRRLRRESLDLRPSISSERAELLTDFYQEHSGRHSVPVMRALSFYHLCQNKTLYLGEEELIVGERGLVPKRFPPIPSSIATASRTSRFSTRGPRPPIRFLSGVSRPTRAR